MLHKSSHERYCKLAKVFRRLMNHFDRDDLDEFIATANSLPEWIRRDPAMTTDQKEALDHFTIPEGIDWQICRSIANQQKHAGPSRNKHVPQVNSVKVKVGGASGFIIPPSMRVVGAGDEIVIDLAGTNESALAFVIRTFEHFRYIFEVAPIPVSQRKLTGLSELLG